MIDGYDAQRIVQDARIAINALESIKYVIERDGCISVAYLTEKTDTVDYCVRFMKGFKDGGD